MSGRSLDLSSSLAVCFCCKAVGLAMVLGVAAASAQPVPDRDTLLLVQCDRTGLADYALGTPTLDVRTHRSDLVEGRFGPGIDLRGNDRVVIVGNDGNFHPPQGTIELWLKPHWSGDDGARHGLLSCRIADRQYVNANVLAGRLGLAVAAGDGDAWTWRRADADIRQWKPETWHHVALAWGDGRLAVFVDGHPGARQPTDAQMPSQSPEAITLSGVDAVIDALHISRRMYTAEDAQRSMRLAQTSPYRYVCDLAWTGSEHACANGRRLLGDVLIPVLLGSQQYAKGIICRAGGWVDVRLDEPYQRFQATVGVCPLGPPDAVCRFEVFGDGTRLFDSGRLTNQEPPQSISVPIRGVKQLRLAVRGEPASASAHGIWAAPVAVRDPDVEVLASRRPVQPATMTMYRRQQDADRFAWAPTPDAAYAVVSKYWEDEVDPARPPRPTRRPCRLEAFATPGEYEPVNFVVYAFEDLDRVALEATDLVCGDRSIPASQIDVRLVLRRLMRDLYTLPPERSTVVSRFLLPHRPVDIPAGTFREYHLIVHVPDDAAAGTYSGAVHLRSAGRPAIELPLELEVLPFRLQPLRDKGYGVYYRFPAGTDDWSGIDVELADIRRHGCNMLKTNLGVDYDADDGRIEPSYQRLRRGLAALRKHGFRGPLPVGTGCEQAARLLDYDPVGDHGDRSARDRFFRAVKAGMEGLVRLAADFPEFELLPTHMDEVFGRDRLERYIRLTEAVRQVPSLRVYITLHNDPRRDASAAMRQCDPFVDVRCYNGHAMDNWVRAGHTFDELAEELARAGDEAWIYHNIRGAFFQAEWTRLVNGYYLWISPLRVHVPWMYYSFKGNPFDATDGPRLRGGDFAYAVPDPHDPKRMVPTRHWEAFREGIDDMRYLTTLRMLAEQKQAEPAGQAARWWLQSLRRRITPTHAELQAIEQESPILVHLARKLDGADYRRIRREAAEHIMALQ